MLGELQKKRKHRHEILKEVKKKKNKKQERKEAPDIMPLYSYGDNKNCGC